jgi:single-strand DNA-binding protein
MANLRLHQLNDVKLVGRLTRDPELRYTPKGQAVCHFRLAVSRRYKDKASNEWREEAAFVPVVAWREAAERCGERLKKGSPVYVEGRLRSRDWETKDGVKRSDLEVESWRIQFLAAAPEGEGAPEADGSIVGAPETDAAPHDESPERSPAASRVPATVPPEPAVDDEEVPF